MDLQDILIKASLVNADTKGQVQRKLQTNDFVFLQTLQEVKNAPLVETLPASTNYAEYNGSFATYHSLNSLNKPIGWYWLRSENFDACASYVGFQGKNLISSQFVDFIYTGIRPQIRLDINKFFLLKSQNENKYEIKKINLDCNNFYHIVEFGNFPQTYVGKNLNEKLTKLLKENKLQKTGKSYLGKLVNKDFIKNEEYIFENEKYVLTFTDSYNNELFVSENINNSNEYEKHTPGELRWIKVEPIKWIVENYNSLPKKLNTDGNGEATYISLISEDILSCMPYNFNHEDRNCELWKFCLIRAYLNGLDMYKDKHDISLSFIYNFTNNNFINEAFKD